MICDHFRDLLNHRWSIAPKQAAGVQIAVHQFVGMLHGKNLILQSAFSDDLRFRTPEPRPGSSRAPAGPAGNAGEAREMGQYSYRSRRGWRHAGWLFSVWRGWLEQAHRERERPSEPTRPQAEPTEQNLHEPAQCEEPSRSRRASQDLRDPPINKLPLTLPAWVVRLQGAQEIQNVLHLRAAERIKSVGNGFGFRASAGVGIDGL